MSYLNFISCATCHGLGTETLHQNLTTGYQPPLQPTDGMSPYFSIPGIGGLNTYKEKAKKLINEQLYLLESQCANLKQDRWGIILASTKGLIEDFVWQEPSASFDPYVPVLDLIKESFPFSHKQSLTVSNACTSSHGALELGQRWLSRNQVDHVFILAIDLIGPFTLKGFATLRALSENHVVRPFDNNRDGLLLGDGIASCVLSQTPRGKSFRIGPVVTLCEGVSATRPDTSGKNLAQCYKQASTSSPEILLAHGTGTYYNDLTESRAVKLAFQSKQPPRVTCGKWGLGHSLGVSGLVDLCLATEILKTQITPGIPTLRETNLEISEWLLKESYQGKVDSVLISSLGFGGMCSAFQIYKEVN